MSFKKHVGRLKNTDRRCVVVMTRIPGREDHALVVDTDALPDRFHDALMHLVESHEGQNVMELHTLLSRRILPDFGVDMLNALHNARAMIAQPISNVMMYPQPHSPVPLSLIVEMIDKQEPVTRDEQVELENRHLENQKLDVTEREEATARNLLIQAADLEAEASKKREQARRIAPTLFQSSAPAVAPAPETPVEAPAAPVAVAEAVEEALPASPAVPFDTDVDVSELPADVADAYIAAVAHANTFTETEAEILSESIAPDEAAHAVDTDDDAIQAFLDRAAYREDRANKIAIEAAEPKRPVGRPRKDGTPAGSPRGA